MINMSFEDIATQMRAACPGRDCIIGIELSDETIRLTWEFLVGKRWARFCRLGTLLEINLNNSDWFTESCLTANAHFIQQHAELSLDRRSRSCAVGDRVKTDFSGKITEHIITDICTDGSHGHSQSGIVFRVSPDVPRSDGIWIDADWFSIC